MNLGYAVLCLVVALALQVGVNYANDYSDGVRGTDQERVGPVRLVGQGLASPAAVKQAAFAMFSVAAVAGLLLTALSGHWLFIAVGALAIVSAWFYTGGTRPYGYAGLGELFVFVWFGLAAVLGTVYSQTAELTSFDFLLAVASGAFSCALLVINNLRDREGDEVVGKRTLAVRLGDARTRAFYVLLAWTAPTASIAVAGFAVGDAEGWPYLAVIGALGGAWVSRPVFRVRRGAVGPQLITALGETTRAQLLWAALTVAGIALQKWLQG